MKSTIIASVLLLASTVAAQPHRAQHQHQHLHAKRDIVVITDIETVTETIESTETVWVTPGAPVATHVSAPSTTLATTTSSPVPAQFFQPSTTTKVAPVPTTSTSIYVAPAPVPTTPAAVAPAPPAPVTPTTEAAPAPEPTTAPVVVIPTVSIAPIIQPSTTAAPPPATTVASGSSPTYTGDITYYDTTGYGACGWINDGTVENVIALPFEFMGLLSNSNPYCGKMVTITLGSASVVAKVVDKCMGCTGMSIDLSHHAFDTLHSEGVGRTTATWSFN